MFVRPVLLLACWFPVVLRKRCRWTSAAPPGLMPLFLPMPPEPPMHVPPNAELVPPALPFPEAIPDPPWPTTKLYDAPEITVTQKAR